MNSEEHSTRETSTASADATGNELERMSGEGGVAPLMPHRQSSKTHRHAAKEDKHLRM